MKTLNKSFEIRNFLIIVISVLLIVNFVAAIGISKEYHSENPAKVGPGEIKEISFGLILASQDDGDRNIELNMTEGNEIATIISDKSFIAKAGSIDNEVRLRVSIPKDTAEGTKYTVTIRVFDKTPPAEGMIGFTTSTTSSIPILVEKTLEPVITPPAEEKPLGNYGWAIIVVVLAIIIAIVAYLFLRNKSK